MVPVDGKEGPPDVCIIELGGTIGTPHTHTHKKTTSKCLLLLLSKERNLCVFVGDNESRPFTDALSQLSYSVGEKVTFCNITGNFLLVPLKSSCTTSKRLHSYFCFNQFLLFNFLVFFRVLFGVFFSQHILRDIYDLSN